MLVQARMQHHEASTLQCKDLSAQSQGWPSESLRLCMKPFLLKAARVVVQAQMQHHLASFMLCDLRRFAMWDSQATRPYGLSAATNWSKALDLGYITMTPSNKVTPDLPSPAL